MDLITKYCDICGKRQATDTHHLILGVSERKICDQYECMKIKVCRQCHSAIHQSAVSETLSKMLGQALFEMNFSYQEYMQLFKKNYLP